MTQVITFLKVMCLALAMYVALGVGIRMIMGPPVNHDPAPPGQFYNAQE